MNKNNTKILLTTEGYQKLREEYTDLTDNKRTEIAEKIQSAREMGDLSENAAYHTAKDEQAYIEGRIAELEEIFRNSDVVEKTVNNGMVTIGSQVQVHIEGEEETFWIVGAHEADPGSMKISHESPIGQALIGRSVGEEIEVAAPVGTIKYKILKVE
jgi:transcription elongation factor GreA